VLWTAAVLALSAAAVVAQDKARKDSPAAAATRKKLQEIKVTVDYKDERLEDVLKDLKNQAETVSFWPDKEGGVSLNQTFTYKATDKPLAEVLDELFKKNDLGYVIGQAKDKRYDGWIIVKKGKFRGDEEISKTPAKTPAKPNPKETTKPKEEAKPKPEDSADKVEQEASRKLKFAKMFEADGLVDKAKEKYKEIIQKYPNTQAAKEAEKLLKK
jgi:hypothetical protein